MGEDKPVIGKIHYGPCYGRGDRSGANISPEEVGLSKLVKTQSEEIIALQTKLKKCQGELERGRELISDIISDAKELLDDRILNTNQ